MGMGQRFEFKSVLWKQEENGEANELGDEGWQLIGTIQPNSEVFRSGIYHGYFVAVLMRQISGPMEEEIVE